MRLDTIQGSSLASLTSSLSRVLRQILNYSTINRPSSTSAKKKSTETTHELTASARPVAIATPLISRIMTPTVCFRFWFQFYYRGSINRKRSSFLIHLAQAQSNCTLKCSFSAGWHKGLLLVQFSTTVLPPNLGAALAPPACTPHTLFQQREKCWSTSALEANNIQVPLRQATARHVLHTRRLYPILSYKTIAQVYAGDLPSAILNYHRFYFLKQSFFAQFQALFRTYRTSNAEHV